MGGYWEETFGMWELIFLAVCSQTLRVFMAYSYVLFWGPWIDTLWWLGHKCSDRRQHAIKAGLGPCGIINFDLFYYTEKLQLSIQLGATDKRERFIFQIILQR